MLGDVAEVAEEIVIDEEKENLEFRVHKAWYISLYNKLFGGQHKKSKSFYNPVIKG